MTATHEIDGLRRGAALPIVLMLAALLAGLAATAAQTSLSGVRAAAAFSDLLQADELGRGAGDALAYHLATGDAAARRGGRIAVRVPGGDVVIDYLSESARIDANLAPVGLIGTLLAAAGAEPADVEAATGRIARFRADAAAAATAGGDAGAGQPAVGGAPPSPAPGLGTTTPPLAIRDTAEVARAWGLSDDLARRVLPALTIGNATPKVDPVLAGRLVLAALLGSDERVDDYLQRRTEGFVNEDSALELLPVPSRTFVGFSDSQVVRAEARVTIGHGFTRRYEMILAPAPETAPGVAAPALARERPGVPVVVSWRRMP